MRAIAWVRERVGMLVHGARVHGCVCNSCPIAFRPGPGRVVGFAPDPRTGYVYLALANPSQVPADTLTLTRARADSTLTLARTDACTQQRVCACTCSHKLARTHTMSIFTHTGAHTKCMATISCKLLGEAVSPNSNLLS